MFRFVSLSIVVISLCVKPNYLNSIKSTSPTTPKPNDKYQAWFSKCQSWSDPAVANVTSHCLGTTASMWMQIDRPMRRMSMRVLFTVRPSALLPFHTVFDDDVDLCPLFEDKPAIPFAKLFFASANRTKDKNMPLRCPMETV